MTTISQPEKNEATICDACQFVPLSALGLDVDEPLDGWAAFLAQRDVPIVLDDVGRPAVSRAALGELIEERREREAQLDAQRAEQAAARKVPIAVGVPAQEGMSAHESMMSGPGYMT